MKKQIEEIKDCIDSVYGCDCAYYGVEGMAIAQALYNAGYRKQVWISVDDRLPELETTRTDGYHRPKSVRVLCACKQRSGKVFVKEGYYEIFSNHPCWRIPGSIDSVTHWMPLPEPPERRR